MKSVQSIKPASSAAALSEARINITNLRLRTYIGFNPEEKSKQQDVVVNAEIRYRADSVARGQRDAQYKYLHLQYAHECAFDFDAFSEPA